jgi:hypothetical protein
MRHYEDLVIPEQEIERILLLERLKEENDFYPIGLPESLWKIYIRDSQLFNGNGD